MILAKYAAYGSSCGAALGELYGLCTQHICVAKITDAIFEKAMEEGRSMQGMIAIDEKANAFCGYRWVIDWVGFGGVAGLALGATVYFAQKFLIPKLKKE